MNELVSIIIPIFNKERFIKKCLRSILTQSYEEIEVVIIDDASSDNSYAICQDAANNDKRIRLYANDSNSGHLKSRYKGIDKATGNWIIFVDADDWLEPDAIKNLYESAKTFDADMVQMRHQRRMKGIAVKYFETFDPGLTGRKITGEEFINLSKYIGMDSYITPSCCGKIYRTDILREAKRINFKQFWGEDQILNINFLRHARSVAFIDFIGYNYRWGGETSNYKFTMLDEYKNVHRLKRLMGQNEDSLNREIIMLLRYHIRQLITELGWTKEAVTSIMRDELNDPLWAEAGLNDSIENLITEETENIRLNPLKYFAKRILR